jgi:pSer/pThr/pTyr-binding forkhead associated (FHA) protein
MKPGDPRGNPQPPRRQATVLESVEEVRAQVRRAAATTEAAVVPRPGASDTGQDAQPFRPTARPPMALLYVLDDGDDGGEVVRIRAGSFVIGRVEGDLVIPHDAGMSGRHLEVTRRLENGEYRWTLTDLQSTNGTFVRAANVIMGHDQELLIGGRRYRFEVRQGPAGGAEPSGAAANATRKWQALAPADLAGAADAVLVEVPQAGEGRRFPLSGPEHWLGRDPQQCTIVVDDPMVDRRHARIYRDEKNRWIIAGARSLNGLWARVQEVALGRGGYFQAGEQRFLLKVL